MRSLLQSIRDWWNPPHDCLIRYDCVVAFQELYEDLSRSQPRGSKMSAVYEAGCDTCRDALVKPQEISTLFPNASPPVRRHMEDIAQMMLSLWCGHSPQDIGLVRVE